MVKIPNATANTTNQNDEKAEICYINKDTKEMETKKATKTNYIISR